VNRLERLYRVHELLRGARHPVPMARFCEELNNTRNTVTRDFQYLKDMFGAPIIYDRERNGHCYDPDAPVFELPGLWMNATELHALLACEQLLESVQPGLMAPRLAPLKTRIRQLLSEAGQEEASVSERVRVQAMQSRPVQDTVFMPVADAVLARRQLQFTYLGRSRDGASTRRVDPQQLLHYRHNWYLLAHCQQAQALRLFSLDRISQPERLENQANDIPPGELSGFANESFGIFSGAPAAHAHLRFSNHAARWVADEQWHQQQRGEWREDGYHLHVPYSNPTELIMDILRHGPEVEVMASPALREAVAEKIRNMQKIY
jgi:predicted DNA-binding transcriptional regulator YafY